MSVGLRVLRGPDWSHDDERDGGEGHLGTVTSVGGEGTCQVLWDNGQQGMYRIGKFGKHDLRIFDNAPIGVRHSQVLCDGCESRGVSGMLWKCAVCKQCSLCSLCYVTDKHDLMHDFTRHATPDSTGEKVKRRSSSLKIRSMGLFPGATVIRGPHWESGNMDGGSGKTGKITEVINNSATPTTRDKVMVTWSSGQVGEHRVGQKGKVDLTYKEESPGIYYYKEHLPLLNAESVQSVTREVEVLQEGDKVCIQVPASSLKAMQADRSGWTSGMTNCIGKIGVIKTFTPTGDATVEFGGLRFRFFPGALKKVPELKVGDVVQIQQEEEKVKMLQEGIGQGEQDIKLVLGKCGKVVKVGEDGNVVVAFGNRTFIIFSACCAVVKGQQVHELAESKSKPSSPRASSDNLGVHGDLLRMMAEVMMRAGDVVSADPDLLYHAIGKGDVSMVRSIAKKAPTLISKPHKGVTPLILAAHEGQNDIVRVLIELGADTKATDKKGHTALHAAIIGKKVQAAQILVEKGGNVDVCNETRRNALHFASFNNLHQVIEALIRKGCNVNMRDLAGDTPLHDAISKGNHQSVAILLRAAKLDLTLCNCKEFNPLQFACFTGNTFATEGILKRDTSTVNLKKPSDQFTALHISAVNDHVDCAKLLVEIGKATIDVKGGDGKTALHLACHEAYLRTTEYLLKKGADPNIKDNQGNTALHTAIGASKLTGMGPDGALFAAMLGIGRRNDDEVRVKLACLLLRNNAIIDAKNNAGRTPLDVAQSPTVKQAVLMFAREQGGNIRKAGASAPTEGIRVRMGPGGLLDMELPCAKCMSKMSDVTLLPCGHKVLCRQCCLVTQNCPICEKHIERRIAKKERTEVLEPECKVQ